MILLKIAAHTKMLPKYLIRIFSDHELNWIMTDSEVTIRSCWMHGFQECGGSTSISYWLVHFLYLTISDPPVLIKRPSRVNLTDKFHRGRGCGGGAFYCCCLVTQSCLTFCDPVDCSTPGLSVPHHLPKFAQVHRWCHPAISSSETLFSFCPQSFPASGTFPVSQLFASDDQNTGVSASASVLPMSTQGSFPLRLTGLISLLSKGLSGVFSSTTVQMHQFFGTLHSLWSSSHNHT